MVAAIASISIVKSTQRENVGTSYNVEGFVRLTWTCAGKTSVLGTRGTQGRRRNSPPATLARDVVGLLDNGGSWESGATISHAFITAGGSASGCVDLAYWPY